MTIRRSLVLSLAVFLGVSGVGVATGVWASGERSRTVEVFTSSLDAQRELGELDQCLQQLHRQISLMGQSFGGDAGSALDPAIRAILATEFDECTQHGRTLTTRQPGAEADGLVAEVDALVTDWRFITENLGVRHVEALARQATAADPRSRALLSERLPALRRAQAERVLEAQRDFAAVSRRADSALALALAGGLLTLTVTAVALVRRLSRALAQLVRGAEHFGAGDFGYILQLGDADEFSAVAAAMNQMAAALRSAQGELTARATILEETVQRLRTAQATLVQQEKMAALGGLVAGVAHEVNTPLGVAVTASSFVRERLDGLAAQAEAGTATRGQVRLAVTDIREALGLLLDNLARAAELIRSFKQVAVDRGQPATRRANLAEWLHGVVNSLSPMARKHGVQIVVEAAASRQVELAAGELEQVLTNLLVNACIHAYPEPGGAPGDPAPCVSVAVTCAPDEVCLTVQDRGVGMPPEVAARVFEPFFTTRRGTGGTGLGLHIAHQLVTERFGGTVTLETAPDDGSRWQVRLPTGTDALRYLGV
jgi:signal transduction histidine kinase